MWYWVFRAIFAIVFKTLFKLKVEGLKNLPKKTNFIIIANHSSFLDPLLIMVAVPRKIYCIASRYLYRVPWLKWFLRKTRAFPTGNSTEKAVSLLIQNKNVGLFPEGKCSLDGSLGQFRRGASLLALKTGRPIVPCAILGAYEALPKTARFPKFLPIRVKIGKPKYLLKQFEDVIEDIYLQDGILKLRNSIKEMLDER